MASLRNPSARPRRRLLAAPVLILLLSAAGVLLLTAVAWLLGFRDAPALTPARARAEAARLPGVHPVDVCLAADGRSALVTGAAGETVLVLPMGDRFIARRLPPGPAPAADTLDLGEPFLRRVRLPRGAVAE